MCLDEHLHCVVSKCVVDHEREPSLMVLTIYGDDSCMLWLPSILGLTQGL